MHFLIDNKVLSRQQFDIHNYKGTGNTLYNLLKDIYYDTNTGKATHSQIHI